MKKYIIAIFLALTVTGCATFDVNFNKYAEISNNA